VISSPCSRQAFRSGPKSPEAAAISTSDGSIPVAWRSSGRIVAAPVERRGALRRNAEPPQEEDEDIAGERSGLLDLRQHRRPAEEGDRPLDIDPEPGAVEHP
jgi:hypothetical protein